jgi:hypothetical protein
VHQVNYVAERWGNGQQGLPKKLIESTSFKNIPTFKKTPPLLSGSPFGYVLELVA